MAVHEQDKAVVVQDLYKSFKLPHEQHSGIKQKIINLFKGIKGYETLEVLNDISFEVKKGEFFGIVGRNGSGKSTLLKLLAGTYVPDRGLVQINGSLTPFIELGVGFNPELTGRENVFLNGALLGFSRSEMDSMYGDIVDFAELGEFMDQKLKNYSSGMQVRLAFSIAIRAESDTLLIDEVLAVGDIAFQQKCFDYFDDLKSSNKTIILVTHDMGAVKQFCDRAVFIKDGVIKAIGEPHKIAKDYEKDNYSSDNDKCNVADKRLVITTQDLKGNDQDAFVYDQDLVIKVNWSPRDEKVCDVGIVITKGGEAVFATNSVGQGVDFDKNEAKLRLKIPIGAGRYKISSTLFGESRRSVIDSSKDYPLIIYDQPIHGDHNDEWQGITYLKNRWLK